TSGLRLRIHVDPRLNFVGEDYPRFVWNSSIDPSWFYSKRPKARIFDRPRSSVGPVAVAICRLKWPRRDQTAQRLDRRAIGDAVDARRPEMPLKRFDHPAAWFVILAGDGNSVTVLAQVVLQKRDLASSVARCEPALRRQRRRFDPVADAGRMQRRPGKFLARIALASGCDIGMSDDAIGADAMPGDEIAA